MSRREKSLPIEPKYTKPQANGSSFPPIFTLEGSTPCKKTARKLIDPVVNSVDSLCYLARKIVKMQEEKKRQKSNSFLIDYLVGDNFITEFREQPAQASPAVDVEDPMVSLVLGCPFGAIGQERRMSQDFPFQRRSFDMVSNRTSTSESSSCSSTDNTYKNAGKFLSLQEYLEQNNLLPPSTMPFGENSGFHGYNPQMNVHNNSTRNGNVENREQRNNSTSPPRGNPPHPLCCCFCFGTASEFARLHTLPAPRKDDRGPWSDHCSKKRGRVVCPKLRSMVCGICGATGDNAHTTKHHLEAFGDD